MRSTMSGSRDLGTQTSSISVAPSRSVAKKAMRRMSSSCCDSASLADTSASSAPCSMHVCCMISARRAASSLSAWAMSSA